MIAGAQGHETRRQSSRWCRGGWPDPSEAGRVDVSASASSESVRPSTDSGDGLVNRLMEPLDPPPESPEGASESSEEAVKESSEEASDVQEQW